LCFILPLQSKEMTLSRPLSELNRLLVKIDGRLYAEYTAITGEYESANMRLTIDHVQNDPFASATRIRVFVAQKRARFPDHSFASDIRKIALRDFINRQYAYEIGKFSRSRGTGKSGEISIINPSPAILERSSVLLHDDQTWEVRLFVGLPASGKHITGHIASEILCQDIPRIVEKCTFYSNLNLKNLKKHIAMAEDADFIRHWLNTNNAVAFIGENAVLQRAENSQQPAASATPFALPDALMQALELPNRGPVKGMVIPAGINVIEGPTWSGKSTFLQALQSAVVNHIPGDGRGYVVTRDDAVTIRTEPGRYYHNVDLSQIIGPERNKQIAKKGLPLSLQNTYSLYLNLLEAIDAGSQLLLMDENTLTPDFITQSEPLEESNPQTLTALVPHLRAAGVSVIFAGRSATELPQLANNVFRLNDQFGLEAVLKNDPQQAGDPEVVRLPQRRPNPRTLVPKKEGKGFFIASRNTHVLFYGNRQASVVSLDGLIEQGQLDAIGQAINYARKELMGDHYALKNIASRVVHDLRKNGWQQFDNRHMGIYVMFRPVDLAMVLNRIPDMEILD
jgi:predicted ABC-class ATPase